MLSVGAPSYRFKNAEQLLADFWKDVEGMLK
jgi:hypothetical protein